MPSERDKSEADVVEGSATLSVDSSIKAAGNVVFSTANIQKKIDEGEYALALILTSTRLESILGQAIQNRVGITEGQFDNLGLDRKSLGSYVEMCESLSVLDVTSSKEELKEIVNLRNCLVHDYGYLEKLEEDSEERNIVKSAVETGIEFIEDTEI